MLRIGVLSLLGLMCIANVCDYAVVRYRAPADIRAVLKEALANCRIAKDGPGPRDFAMVFVKRAGELRKTFPTISKQLASAAMFWVSWPKKSSGVATDLSENEVRRIGLEAGLVDVKVCAVTTFGRG